MTMAISFDWSPEARRRRGDRIAVEEAWWGYVLRSAEGAEAARWLFRLVATFLASAALVAIAALWLMPASALPMDPAAGRVGASGLLLALAGLSLWLTRQGFAPEVQVDLHRREVRLVVRGGDGRTLLTRRTAFADIGGVHLDRSAGGKGRARLVLRWRNTSRTLGIVAGDEATLAPLRDRIGRDLTVPAFRA